jgi:hypothetical protein
MSSPEHDERVDDNKQDELDETAGELEEGTSRPVFPVRAHTPGPGSAFPLLPRSPPLSRHI